MAISGSQNELEQNYKQSRQLGGQENESNNEWRLLPNAEPQVDLTTVDRAWWIAFKSHWIIFAICFALLMLYNSHQLYKTYRRSKMANRSYVFIVQTLVILLCFTRVLALCISPYELISNTPNRVPYVFSRLLFAFGYPCLFSGFTFVHKIFLNVSKIQVISRNAIGNKTVAVVLIIHFLAVLFSEIITSYVSGTKFLLVICALYYFTGCLGIALSLLFSGRRVVKKIHGVSANLGRFNHAGKNLGESFAAGKAAKDKTVEASSKVIKITALTAVFGFLCALFYIYTLVWMIRASTGDTSLPDPCTWLIVNTFLRLLELFLAAAMSYAVGSSYQRNNVDTKMSVSRCEDIATTPL